MPSRRTWLCLLFMVAWLPVLRWVFTPDGVQSDAEALAKGQMSQWRNSRQEPTVPMRAVNPEWDFMTRTFTVLALTNRALRLPSDSDSRELTLKTIDQIINSTLQGEQRYGAEHFTLSYIHSGPFLNREERSLFIDGELLMMMSARQLVEPVPERVPEMQRRARLIREHMQQGPVLSGESYPNECWTFCNTTALAALRLYDAALFRSETEHAQLARNWVEMARERLIEPNSGLLVSSYRYDGSWLDGPEGSSLWMSAHNLKLIDEPFAREQYQAARQQLGFSILGFGLAREWPSAHKGRMDVDSGPVIPLLDASPGSSGLALLGAASFGDDDYLLELRRSLELTAFPIRRRGRLKFKAAGLMGDAVASYALSQGPLWALAQQRLSSAKRTAVRPTLPIGQHVTAFAAGEVR